MITSFKQWHILPKIIAIFVVNFLVMLISTQTYFIPHEEKWMMDEKKTATRQVVEAVYGILVHYNNKVKQGELTREQAEKSAMEMIKGLRYRDREYFWINDLKPSMIMHPTVSELDGQDLTNYSDSNGKYLFREFISATENSGSGFVEYTWPKPGSKHPVPKLSFVKRFEPWGWIIGSGVYFDDIQEALETIRLYSYGGVFLFACINISLAWMIGFGITSRLRRVKSGLREISEGMGEVALTKRIAVNSHDEIGALTIEFNALMDSIYNLTNFKKVIDEDDTLEEIYSRLSQVFMREEGILCCVVYELDATLQKIHAAYTTLKKDQSLPCDPAILTHCQLCRARKTGTSVSSFRFQNICKQFLLRDTREHICLPMVTSGTIIGIFHMTLERRDDAAWNENIARKINKAEQYLQEALPVIEAKRLLKTLRESALLDPLTGLHNRRFMQESIENICSGTQRRGKHLGILMCDIDHFKSVNDTYGHNAGDELLKGVAKIIRTSVRASDIVIRFGGEEFLIVLVDIEPDESRGVAEKIRQAIEEHPFNVSQGVMLRATISVGISEFSGAGDQFRKALKFADVALYRSKEGGRNRCTNFVQSMWDEAKF